MGENQQDWFPRRQGNTPPPGYIKPATSIRRNNSEVKGRTEKYNMLVPRGSLGETQALAKFCRYFYLT
jgi:hypothetical protein